MSKTFLAGTFAVLIGVSLAAQAPAQQSQPQGQSPAAPAITPPPGTTASPQAPADAADQSVAKAAATDTVTLEGCIQRSVQAPSATATAGAVGTAGTTASGGPFLLANAMKSTSTPGAAAGTSGASAASAAIVSTYRLDADDSKLSPHVGHKVEITGTIEDRAETAASPSSSAATAVSSPKLKVENVRMLAEACTP
jgi:hypothetical protein